jgi:hypothetical protein
MGKLSSQTRVVFDHLLHCCLESTQLLKEKLFLSLVLFELSDKGLDLAVSARSVPHHLLRLLD